MSPSSAKGPSFAHVLLIGGARRLTAPALHPHSRSTRLASRSLPHGGDSRVVFGDWEGARDWGLTTTSNEFLGLMWLK